MTLAEPGSKIWIDNMSIDQNSYSDVAAQVAVIGDGRQCTVRLSSVAAV